MTNNSIPLEHLRDRCKARFKEFGMTDKQIDSYHRNIGHIINYMERNSIKEYTHEVCESFILYLRETSAISPSSKKRDITTTRLINLVLDNLPYKAIHQKHVSHDLPDTEFGRLAKAYCDKLFADGQLRKSSILQYEYYLSYFAIAMKIDGVEVKDFTRAHVLRYLSGKPSVTTRKISLIKVFLHVLYEQGETKEDLSLVLKHYKIEYSEKVVSYYTPEEIQQIESSIDRSSTTGKRNYAIVMLASRLGLRSSDICNLMFSNLDRDNCIINLRQYKTGRRISLPLLSEVGDALIDYIMNARPKCDLKTVFVSMLHPYTSLRTVALIVNEIIVKSGVNTSGKHHGAHALRHSLATAMMSEKTDLPTISAALGHVKSESTMFYLGVNIGTLMECSHEVPPVDDSFYMQKGGIFYER